MLEWTEQSNHDEICDAIDKQASTGMVHHGMSRLLSMACRWAAWPTPCGTCSSLPGQAPGTTSSAMPCTRTTTRYAMQLTSKPLQASYIVNRVDSCRWHVGGKHGRPPAARVRHCPGRRLERRRVRCRAREPRRDMRDAIDEQASTGIVYRELSRLMSVAPRLDAWPTPAARVRRCPAMRLERRRVRCRAREPRRGIRCN